jgi:trk system potassium uptake protein TrkA
MRRLDVPGAFILPMADGKVRIIGVRAPRYDHQYPLRHLTQLFPDLNIIVIGIVRDGKGPCRRRRSYAARRRVYFVSDAERVVAPCRHSP